MLILGLTLNSQEPQDPKKEKQKKEVPETIVADTTTISISQRDTILIEQRKLNTELKELVEKKKKEEK